MDIAADDRFAGLWSRPEYAIDKTDQRFKASKSMDKLLTTIRTKRERDRSRMHIEHAEPTPAAGSNDVDQMVARLKAKAAKKTKK